MLALDRGREALNMFSEYVKSKPWYIKLILSIAAAIAFAANITIIVFHKVILHKLLLASQYWQSLGLRGQLVIGCGFILVSFPPLSGFTLLVTITGIVYGVPKGLLLASLFSTIGSLASFTVVNALFKKQAERLVNKYDMIKQLTVIVRDSETSQFQETLSLMLLRLLPLPYSMTNGAIACIPGVSILCFGLATLLASPKNAVALFVGHQMRKLGEEGDSSSKWRDVIIMLITGATYAIVSALLYKMVQERLQRTPLDNIDNDYSDDELSFEIN